MERVLPYTRSCFVCGAENVVGFRLRVQVDGHDVRTRFTPRPEHGGFLGIVHGGVAASLLDEVMVWAASIARRRFCYTATFSIRYLRPWRVGVPVDVVARGNAERPRRVTAEGWVRNDAGMILARADGVFLPVPPDDVEAFSEDFLPDPTAVPLGEIVPESLPGR